MELAFYKYQGTGNDFILIDNRSGLFQLNNYELIKRLCDRHFGIGADGLMLLENIHGYDFSMVYYNSNGKPGSMCGNGGRCIVAFAKQLGIIDSTANFLAVDGKHSAKISESVVSLQMVDVASVSCNPEYWIVNTGSPHYVCISDTLATEDVFKKGQSIRNSILFKEEGINVNFVQAESLTDHYFVRTYERGVENETFACGTGVTAVALAMAEDSQVIGPHTTYIRTLGGNLTINFERNTEGNFKNVYLMGSVEFVFKGCINF